MSSTSRGWADLFDLARAAHGPREWVWPGGGPSARMFGGQLMAQVMVAAAATVPNEACPTSVHALFLRPADASQPVCYAVEELRTGRAYSTRVTRAAQEGRLVMHATTQWHAPESWRRHNDRVAPPALPGGVQTLPYPAPGVLTELLDLRWVDRPTGRGLWFRVRPGVEIAASWHSYVACYVSDLWLGDAVLRRHELTWASVEVRPSSLEHAVWIHRELDLAEWVYLESVAPVCDDGRGFVSGQLRTSEGELAMTVQQDVSIRSAGAPLVRGGRDQMRCER